MSRIVDSGAGCVASYYSTFLPDGQPTIIHVAKREWVQKNAAAAKGFREAVQEAAAFMGKPANDAKVRAHIGKYIKLPPRGAGQGADLAALAAGEGEKQLAYWVGLMKDQEMLKTEPQVANLLAK